MPRKDYREAHRKKLASAARRYYREHREECVARNRRYRETHPEEIVAGQRRHYREHREKKLAYQRKYQQEHRKEVAAYRAKWPKCYRTWMALRNRCSNPRNRAYKRYGGRGIKVCERWESFATFMEDVGDRPAHYHLHRINNDGDYEKSNCVWISKSEHMKLTRTVMGKHIRMEDLQAAAVADVVEAAR